MGEEQADAGYTVMKHDCSWRDCTRVNTTQLVMHDRDVN